MSVCLFKILRWFSRDANIVVQFIFNVRIIYIILQSNDYCLRKYQQRIL